MSKLRETAEILKRSGWVKGTTIDKSGQHCVMGGLLEAYGAYRVGAAGVLPNDEYVKDRHALSVTVKGMTGRLESITGYNDAPDTTFEDILKVLDIAAKMREAQDAV